MVQDAEEDKKASETTVLVLPPTPPNASVSKNVCI